MDDASQAILLEFRVKLGMKLVDPFAGGRLQSLTHASLGHLVRHPSRHADARRPGLGADPGQVGLVHADGDVLHHTKIV